MIHTCTITRRRAAVLGIALLVAGGCRDDAGSPTSPEPGAALDITPTHDLSFRQVSAGENYACGVTTANRAYCWGDNLFGQLGDGTTTDRVRPVPVAGGRRFLRVSAGFGHTCAVNPFNRGFCWGANFAGQLGDNTTTQRLTPVRVAGGLLFRQVAVGKLHSCGVTTGDQAYCWGKNSDGQLGDGTLHTRLKPVPVAGGLSFRQVTAGITQQQQQPGYSCGVTTDNLAYCWGGNSYGRLGIGTLERRLRPTAVVGGLQFRQVDAGGNHACAVTTDDRAYCWGRNEHGQLGNDTVGDSSSPVPVLGAS